MTVTEDFVSPADVRFAEFRAARIAIDEQFDILAHGGDGPVHLGLLLQGACARGHIDGSLVRATHVQIMFAELEDAGFYFHDFDTGVFRLRSN